MSCISKRTKRQQYALLKAGFDFFYRKKLLLWNA